MVLVKPTFPKSAKMSNEGLLSGRLDLGARAVGLEAGSNDGSSDGDGSSRAGAFHNDRARVPLQPEPRGCEGCPERDAGNDTDTSESGSSGRRQSWDGREQAATKAIDGGDFASGAISAASRLASPSLKVAPPTAAVAPTAVATAKRASEMFDPSATWVRAVGPLLGPLARSSATNELILFAFEATRDLFEERGTALSEAFGNFDRVVAVGYLLRDELGHPLLPHEAGLKAAHRVGLKVRRAYGNLIADQVSQKRAARKREAKLPVDDPKREAIQQEAGVAAAALLKVEVELPMEPPPAAAGSRKRARSPVMNELEAEMHEAQKEVVAAFAALGKAQDKALQAWRRLPGTARTVEDITARKDDCEARMRESLEAEVRYERAEGEVSLCTIDILLDSMGQPRLDR